MRTVPREGQLLRIFIGEQDQWHGQPLAEAIVLLARKHGLAGATCVKGFLGFGAKSQIHTAKLLRLSEDLPIIIEIVDSAEHIANFLPQLDAMITDGLVTLERAEVLIYRTAGPRAS
jgi:PII-like signaling protein